MQRLQANNLRLAMDERRRARGLLLTIPTPHNIELFGHAGGFDFVMLDGEHGAFNVHNIAHCCRAADLAGITPIARVPEISKAAIGRFLDAGARGIVAPHVNSAEAAAALVAACRYAPLGQKSYGAGRSDGLGAGIADLAAHCAAWNATVTIGAMIEDREGIDNLDAILATPGIDYYMIGGNDFAQAMGHPGEPDAPAVARARHEVEARIRAAGCRLREDIMDAIWINDLLRAGADAFLAGLHRSDPG